MSHTGSNLADMNFPTPWLTRKDWTFFLLRRRYDMIYVHRYTHFQTSLFLIGCAPFIDRANASTYSKQRILSRWKIQCVDGLVVMEDQVWTLNHKYSFSKNMTWHRSCDFLRSVNWITPIFPFSYLISLTQYFCLNEVPGISHFW